MATDQLSSIAVNHELENDHPETCAFCEAEFNELFSYLRNSQDELRGFIDVFCSQYMNLDVVLCWAGKKYFMNALNHFLSLVDSSSICERLELCP